MDQIWSWIKKCVLRKMVISRWGASKSRFHPGPVKCFWRFFVFQKYLGYNQCLKNFPGSGKNHGFNQGSFPGVRAAAMAYEQMPIVEKCKILRCEKGDLSQDRTHDACLMSKALHHLGKKRFFPFQNYIMADILIFSWLRRQKLWIAG